MDASLGCSASSVLMIHTVRLVGSTNHAKKVMEFLQQVKHYFLQFLGPILCKLSHVVFAQKTHIISENYVKNIITFWTACAPV